MANADAPRRSRSPHRSATTSSDKPGCVTLTPVTDATVRPANVPEWLSDMFTSSPAVAGAATEFVALQPVAVGFIGIEITFPMDLYPGIIGMGGTCFNELRARIGPGCEVRVDRDEDGNKARITLGPASPEALERAKVVVFQRMTYLSRAIGSSPSMVHQLPVRRLTEAEMRSLVRSKPMNSGVTVSMPIGPPAVWEQVMIPQQQPGVRKDPDVTVPKGYPTKTVLLTNLVGAGEVDEDLHEEIVEEANKYGKLLKCVIKESKNVPDDQAVRIFLQYDRVVDAEKACNTFYARYFGGRTVKARYYDDESFEEGDFKNDSLTFYKDPRFSAKSSTRLTPIAGL